MNLTAPPILLRVISYLILCGIFTTGTSGSNGRPNILFIFVDDQSPLTLSAYGNEVCDTPNLDRLAREGMVLDGAHHMGSWAGAVCLPSRTMVQTSVNVWKTMDIAKRYPRMNPENYVHQPEKLLAELKPDDPDYHSMPAIFNRAGYDTFRTCKIGNTYEGANRLYMGRQDQTNYGPEDETGSWWHGEQVMNYLTERESSIPSLFSMGSLTRTTRVTENLSFSINTGQTIRTFRPHPTPVHHRSKRTTCRPTPFTTVTQVYATR
jgi:choline-sulfatase